jgi:hypothetical protein
VLLIDAERTLVEDSTTRRRIAVKDGELRKVTWALELDIVTTLFTPPPSTIVVLALAPRISKLKPIVRFSV